MTRETGAVYRKGPLRMGTPVFWFLVSVVIRAGVSYWCAAHRGHFFRTVFLPLSMSWCVAAWATEAYRHKYARRYFSYLAAARLKMALIMAVLLSGCGSLIGGFPLVADLLTAGGIALGLEFFLSLFLRWPVSKEREAERELPANDCEEEQGPSLADVNHNAVRNSLNEIVQDAFSGDVRAFILENLGDSDSGTDLVEIISEDKIPETTDRLGLLVQTRSFNALRRLNIFLKDLPAAVEMGGYFVFRYRPLEEELEELREEKSGPGLLLAYAFHFIWFRALPKIPILEKVFFLKPFGFLDEFLFRKAGDRRRVLARAEVWGRMAFWGFEVLAERKSGNDHWVVSRRIESPESKRQPSFFLVVGLQKVGLDGVPLRLHKLRTMYPFSEFIQAKLYRDHGLSETGKFKDDFRLTDYGKFLRKYWLDEIPQVWDWLRGDIKLVGMRATSPHFLGLYPKELYDLYIQIKPGLIPPIFDENTQGFEDIVRIELEYLQAHYEHPVVTDIRYFFRTFNDIVFRGVRSK